MKPGDWLVRDGGYGYEVVQAERVTPGQVWPVAGSGGHYTPKRLDRSTVLYAGDEAAVRSVREKLSSSKALANEEKRKADQRHRDRVAKLTRPTP